MKNPGKWLGINQGLCQSEQDRARHIAALSHLGESQYDGVFSFLYQNLSIVDGKTAALLQFNGIMLTLSSIIITVSSVPWVKFVFLLPLILFLISSMLSLNGIWVHWASTAELLSGQAYMDRLLVIRDRRTRAYRQSWLLAWLGIVCVFVLIGLSEVAELKAPKGAAGQSVTRPS